MKKRKYYKYSIQVRKKLTWFASLIFFFKNDNKLIDQAA